MSAKSLALMVLAEGKGVPASVPGYDNVGTKSDLTEVLHEN